MAVDGRAKLAALDVAGELVQFVGALVHSEALVQNGYSLLQPDDGANVRAPCGDRGLAFTECSPLARGVLTGKYEGGATRRRHPTGVAT